VPNDEGELENCFCADVGVPRDTDRGDAVSRGDGRVPEGDALYRGGVIVSVMVAMGVMSAMLVFWR
jgi:hypothetical protein